MLAPTYARSRFPTCFVGSLKVLRAKLVGISRPEE